MDTYRVAEKFVSINGEAAHAGELACFIRFAGCNLRCGYCDTAWAYAPDVPYTTMTGEEICTFVRDSKVGNVTLTGGEPLIQPNIGRLIGQLGADPSLRVEIETNGSVSIEPYRNRTDNICMTLDYKLPGSGMESQMDTENYRYLKPQDVVKFVISDHGDLEKAKQIIAVFCLTEKATVYLSSAFSRISPAEIVDFMMREHMRDVRMQLQLHKYIWDPDRKGV